MAGSAHRLGTESLSTLRWRETDSKFLFRDALLCGATWHHASSLMRTR